MKQSDLPNGWNSTPPANSDDDSDGVTIAALAKCVGAPHTQADDVTDVASPSFSLNSATISSNASGFRSQSTVDSDRAILKNSKFAGCFKKLITPVVKKSLPSDAKITSMSVKVTQGAGGGPTNVAGSIAVTVNIDYNGTPVPVYIADTFLTGPKIEANVIAQNIGETVPADVLKNAVKAIAKRTAKA